MESNDAPANRPAKKSSLRKRSVKRVVSEAGEEVSEGEEKERALRGDVGVAVDVAIASAVAAIQLQATKEGNKSTIADLVRLLQLRKELDGERPRKITARWIEECKPSTEE